MTQRFRQVLLAFTIQQFLEEIAGNREGWYAPAPHGSRLAGGLKYFHGPSIVYFPSNSMFLHVFNVHPIV